jgi:hypothetical protein
MQLLENRQSVRKDFICKSEDNMIVWKNKLLFILNEHRLSLSKAPDILLVHHPRATPACLDNDFPSRIILTGKVPPWNQKKWLEYGEMQKISVDDLDNGYVCLRQD